jgi:hypothetical protein
MISTRELHEHADDVIEALSRRVVDELPLRFADVETGADLARFAERGLMTVTPHPAAKPIGFREMKRYGGRSAIELISKRAVSGAQAPNQRLNIANQFDRHTIDDEHEQFSLRVASTCSGPTPSPLAAARSSQHS